jgi:hypothetical protein
MELKASGAADSEQYPELGFTACKNGIAEAIPGNVNNTFRCGNVSSTFAPRMD